MSEIPNYFKESARVILSLENSLDIIKKMAQDIYELKSTNNKVLIAQCDLATNPFSKGNVRMIRGFTNISLQNQLFFFSVMQIIANPVIVIYTIKQKLTNKL